MRVLAGMLLLASTAIPAMAQQAPSTACTAVNGSNGETVYRCPVPPKPASCQMVFGALICDSAPTTIPANCGWRKGTYVCGRDP